MLSFLYVYIISCACLLLLLLCFALFFFFSLFSLLLCAASPSPVLHSNFTNWLLACSHIEKLPLHAPVPIITTWMFYFSMFRYLLSILTDFPNPLSLGRTQNSIRNTSTILSVMPQ